MTPAPDVRPALQGDPRDIAEWALRALAHAYGLTDDEVASVAEAFMQMATEAASISAELDDAPAGRHCLNCGCSDARPCPGGCIWATATLCSRCAA